MDVVNYSDFRANLRMNLDKVSLDKETVIVSRGQDKNVVLISLDEFNSYNETIYLMQSAKNRDRLLESITEFESGKSLAKELIED